MRKLRSKITLRYAAFKKALNVAKTVQRAKTLQALALAINDLNGPLSAIGIQEMFRVFGEPDTSKCIWQMNNDNAQLFGEISWVRSGDGAHVLCSNGYHWEVKSTPGSKPDVK